MITEVTAADAVPSTPDRKPALPRALLVLLGAAALVVVVAGIRGFAALLAPLFLALVMTIAVAPLTHWLRSRGLPGWLSTLVGIVAVYLVLVVLAGSLVYSIARLATALPAYSEQFDALVTQGTSLLERIGIDRQQIETGISQVEWTSVVGVLQNILGQIAASWSA